MGSCFRPFTRSGQIRKVKSISPNRIETPLVCCLDGAPLHPRWRSTGSWWCRPWQGLQGRWQGESGQELEEQAQARFEERKTSLEKARQSCQASLETLGRRKLQVMDTEMRRFAVSFGRLKNVRLTDVPSMARIPDAELQAMEQPAIGFGAVDALKALAASGAAGATAGFVSYGAVGALATASTSAAISGLSGIAAANATLAWFGGGALSAGGLGMAGGAWILGSIVTGPVLAIGGMVMSAKSKEALANAMA